MGSYRHITGQIITLLTLLASIMGVLRQVEDSRISLETTIERGEDRQSRTTSVSRVSNQVKQIRTKLR